MLLPAGKQRKTGELASAVAEAGISTVTEEKKNDDPDQAVASAVVAVIVASPSGTTVVAAHAEKKKDPDEGKSVTVTHITSTVVITGCLAVCCS